MTTRTEMLVEVLLDFLAHARGCRHSDHEEHDRAKCETVAERIVDIVETKVENKIDDHVDSWHRRDE